ncbi:MAG: hypothetical protein NC043_00890 [Muribaculaceae bacterium]|nr:hypothetical protein [Muribaculaceae bacterium]
MKELFISISVCLLAVMAVSCSGSKSADAADAQMSEIENAIKAGEGARAVSTRVDSMALEADDLTPSQAVQVLVAYMRIHEEAKQNGDTQLDMETLRKFVDVYDIVTSVGGSEMTETFRALAARSPRYDIPAAAKEYRAILADYADGTSSEEEAGAPAAPKAETDSVAAASTDESSAPDMDGTGVPDGEDSPMGGE